MIQYWSCLKKQIAMLEKSKSDRGQTIVEFAFIIVLFFILILGIMEYGIVLYNQSVLKDACREGARSGVMYRADPATFSYNPMTAAEIRTVIANYVQSRLLTFGTAFNPATDVIVTWSPNPTYPPAQGDDLEVRVNFTYRFLALPYLGNAGWNSTALSARSVMRME